ncbi:GNAT family N-acetyltransferase [Phaeacidiphilus oryzae]|uniref:GNAT family N-acetyltransferase n=1 Tax=Phaeacidiphilus oryzae TaxID=348818 RepID=UPI000569B98F|nr:GNAT family protein [Phaeacidiphilus oryzae]
MTSFWTGERVRLRAIETADAEAFLRFAEEEERLGGLLLPPRSAASYETWAKAQSQAQSAAEPEGEGIQLVIEAVGTGQAVGAVSVRHADPVSGCFEYGVTIGADHRRAGYAAEAVVMVLRYMFDERRYHKCQARVFAHNEPSLAFHRRLGFTEEGRLRDQVFFAGRHHDLVLFGILAPEFAGAHPLPPSA